MTTNKVHQGYVDGLSGRDPNPELEKSYDYQEGWLHGSTDHAAGKTCPKWLGYYEDGSLPLKRGQTVTIRKGTMVKNMGKAGTKPAGRTYQVKINHFGGGCSAYLSYHQEFVRPTPPTVVWPGAGSYWSEADLNEIPEAQS